MDCFLCFHSFLQVGFRDVSDGLRNQWRDCIANDAELMSAGNRKLKPVRETLHTGSLARRERAVLCRMDEHQSVLAQMRDDGGAGFVAMLAGIAILERLLVVGELEFLAALHRLGAVFAFVQPGKIAQITFAVRARAMCRQFRRPLDFKRLVEITSTIFGDIGHAPGMS